MGPVEAVPKALAKAGLTFADIEVIELDEAFAAQVVAVVRRLGLDESRPVAGGAIALGHPLGATGAKLSVQILAELGSRKARYGLVTMCVGGGRGPRDHRMAGRRQPARGSQRHDHDLKAPPVGQHLPARPSDPDNIFAPEHFAPGTDSLPSMPSPPSWRRRGRAARRAHRGQGLRAGGGAAGDPRVRDGYVSIDVREAYGTSAWTT